MHLDGSGDDDPPPSSFGALYDELKVSDSEHGDVAMVHEDSGWLISAHRDGRVILSCPRTRTRYHMIPVSKEKVLALWNLLIKGEIEQIRREPWMPGHRT